MDTLLVIGLVALAFWAGGRRVRSADREPRRARRATQAAAQVPGDPVAAPDTPVLTPRGMEDLMVLHLAMARHWPDPQVRARVQEALDGAWRAHLAQGGVTPDGDAWRARLDEAWGLLEAQGRAPAEPPPWRAPARQASPPEALSWDVEPLPEPGPAEAPPRDVPALSRETRALVYAKRPAPPGVPPAAPGGDGARDATDFALAPHVPSAMERLFAAVSRWPRIAAPFLAQNIGWFIGGFCFVAGSLFLVSYTSGLANAFAVFGSLALYTGALLGAGYHLRRRRPELSSSSAVLLATAVLLIPLDFTALANVLGLSLGQPALALLAWAIAAASGLAAYYGARLATGLMDRSLPGRHASLLVTLAASQLAAPYLAPQQHWGWLAAAHVLLLGLAGYALVAFSDTWVRSVFVDRRRIAWYGAGTLLFAGTVAFVHLGWTFSGPLPDGYAGPYTMTLAGLLFYLDATLERWTARHPLLSRLSFALYGLSVVAVLLTYDAPGPRALTLALGALVYAALVRQYLTLTPLYLLLGALSGLYFTGVLEPLPATLWLLGAVPGLAGLGLAARWSRRRAASLARGCAGALAVLALGTGAVSLWHGQPGPAAAATALVMAATLAYLAIGARGLFSSRLVGAARYGALGLLALACAYVPTVGDIPRSVAGPGLLLALAGLGGRLALARPAQRAVAESLLNGALLFATAALLWAGAEAIGGRVTAAMLAALLLSAGALLAWLAVALRVRALVYGCLAALAAGAAIVRHTYFAGPGTGLSEMLAALATWALLRVMDRPPSPERRQLEAERSARRSPLTVLWRLQASRS